MTDDKIPTDNARRRVNEAIVTLVESINELEQCMYDALYWKAFNDGVEWIKSEFKRVSGSIEPDEPKPIVQTGPLSDVEKLTDQSIYAYIVNNPGLRSSDVIVEALKLPVKPALTEQSVRGTINRLKREGRIDSKSGRWYSTQAKATAQQFQVMAYLPDGSKYLGTDVINERKQ